MLEGHTYGPGKSALGQVRAGPGTPTYSITAGNTGDKFTVSADGTVNLNTAGSETHSSVASDTVLSITAAKDDDTLTAQVTIRVVNKLDDAETHTIGDVTWTRVEETNFLIAEETANGTTTRKPELELNAKLHCQRLRLLDKTLTMWIDEDVIHYQTREGDLRSPAGKNPLLVNTWHTFLLGTPQEDGNRMPHQDGDCPPDVTDLWAENYATKTDGAWGRIYQMDDANALVKVYDVDRTGLIITRNPTLDIPIDIDHYRQGWPVRGIWGNSTHIWVTAALESVHELEGDADTVGLHSAAYSRTTFLRDETKDIEEGPDHEKSGYLYRPDDYMFQGDVHWMVHTQEQILLLAIDPDDQTTEYLCDDDGDTATPGIELKVDQSSGGRFTFQRIIGRVDPDAPNTIYVLRYGTDQILSVILEDNCTLRLIETQYSYNRVQNIPAEPGHPRVPQLPVGISTNQVTDFIYVTYRTGEIRHMPKITPLVDDHTVNIPENLPAGTHIGRRIRVDGQKALHTWELSGTGSDKFEFETSGRFKRHFQLMLKEPLDYENEDPATFTLTATAKDMDHGEDQGTITVNLLNVQEQATGPLQITGTPNPGQTLTADTSKVADPDGLSDPQTYEYQWYANNTKITRATAKTLDLTQAHANSRTAIHVEAAFTDTGSFANRLRSAPVTARHPSVEIEFSNTDAGITEGEEIEVDVTLTKAPGRAVDVEFRAYHSSEASSSDYTVDWTSAKLAFAAADTSKTLTIAAVDDDVDEDDDETVIIQFRTLPTGFTRGADSSLTLTIKDNDTAEVIADKTSIATRETETGTYNVKLGSQPTHDVEVEAADTDELTLTPSGRILTFTEDNWNINQTVTVRADQDSDAVDEVKRSIIHTVDSDDPKYQGLTDLPEIEVTVTDNDTAQLLYHQTNASIDEGGVDGASCPTTLTDTGATTLGTLYNTTTPTAPLTVTITGHTGTDLCLKTVMQSYTVDQSETDADDEADRGFELVLKAKTLKDIDADDEAINLVATVTSSDPMYNGGDAADDTGTDRTADDDYVDNDVVKFNVKINDSAPDVTVSFGAATATATEGGSSAAITVNVNEDAERPLTIPVNITDQDGATDKDYNITGLDADGNLIIPKDDTTASFTVTATDDDINDDGEKLKLSFGTLGPKVTAGTRSQTTVTIADNDEAGLDIDPPGTLELTENQNPKPTYKVSLTSEPTGDIEVEITSSDTAVMTVSPAEFTFKSTNWDKAQTVTVTGVDDPGAEDHPGLENNPQPLRRGLRRGGRRHKDGRRQRRRARGHHILCRRRIRGRRERRPRHHRRLRKRGHGNAQPERGAQQGPLHRPGDRPGHRGRDHGLLPEQDHGHLRPDRHHRHAQAHRRPRRRGRGGRGDNNLPTHDPPHEGRGRSR